ncbi:MAG: hypothetical protein WC674_10280 [Candidatus Krumholzibacteriia bacterium]
MKRWVGFAAILFLLALTAGCPYTTKAPLGDPDRHSFDKRLVGLWMGYDNEGDSTLIRVLPFNDAEYYVETDEQGKEPSRYRAFVFAIGGQQFIHLNELSKDGAPLEYCFARYAFSASGELSLRFVGEKIVPKALATDPKALNVFLAKHLGDPALDDEDVTLLLRRRS